MRWTHGLRWLVLVLAGWLTYALGRALWTHIVSGLPVYDWLWYLPVGALLILLPLHLTWRWRWSRRAVAGYGLLLLWVLLGYHPPATTEYLTIHDTPHLSLAFWGSRYLVDTPDTVLRDLQTADATLYLDMVTPLTATDTVALADGLRRLGRYDIDVVLLPALPDFLSVPVHTAWMAESQAVAAFVARERLDNVRGLIGDAEPPLHAPWDLLGLRAAETRTATLAMQQTIAELQQAHPDLTMEVTAFWPLYLDGLDGDDDLAVAVRSPVDPPGNWDVLNLMAYSSYVPVAHQPYKVVVLERMMLRRYPNREVTFLIGLVGGGFPWEPLLSYQGIVRDARLSRALQVEEAVVFHLDNALTQLGHDFVGRLSQDVNGTSTETVIAVPFSRRVSLENYGIALADAVLDLRGRLWQVGTGWLLISAGIIWMTRQRNDD